MNTKDINSPKTALLIQTAKKLFEKYGIKKVSIKEICQEAGVSKMTFYRSFDNKIALAKTVLELFLEKNLAEYQTLMQQPISFKEKMEQALIQKQQGLNELSEEFLKDIQETKETVLLHTIAHYTKKISTTVLNDYILAQQKGDIRPDIKPEFIHYFLHKSQEMAKDPYLLSIYTNRKELTMEITRFFFHGIMNYK